MKRNFFVGLLAVALFVGCCGQPKSEVVQEPLFGDLMEQVSDEQRQAWYDGASCITEECVAEHGAEIKAAKRLICFDLDGTLSNHRTDMPAESRELLDKLKAAGYDLVMVGAGNAPRIHRQMGQYPIDIIANYGKQLAEVQNGELVITREEIDEVDREFFTRETNRLREKYGYTKIYGESIEWHKSGMVTFALLGTEAPKAEKHAFDPDRAKRRVMYPEVLEIFKDFTVFIGGSSSFDIVGKNYNKYDAVMRYAAEKGYSKSQVLYIGDDMGDGGGDSHVRLGGMDYVHITDFTKVAERLAFLL